METGTFFIYLAVIAGSTYLIRVIPFVLVNKKVTNKYVRSFLYYIPYAVLAAMTVPAAFYATRSVISAVVGIVVAALVSLKCKSLVVVAAVACITVFLVELIVVNSLSGLFKPVQITVQETAVFRCIKGRRAVVFSTDRHILEN